MRIVLLLLLSFLTISAAVAVETIGLPLPLDGRLAPLGESVKLGAEVAASDLQKEGKTVRLVFANDTCKPKSESGAADALAGVEIIVGSVCFQSAKLLAKKLSIPVVALDTRNNALSRLRSVEKLPIFEVSLPPDAEANAIVERILPRFDGKPFAIIDDGSVYGRNLSDALRLLGEQAGFKPAAVDRFRPLQTTHRSTLRRLERSGVEALFVIGDAEDLVTMARDMRQLNYNWSVGTGARAELIEYTPGFLDVPLGWLSVKLITPPLTIDLIEKLYAAPVLEAAAKGYAMVQIAAQFDGTLKEQLFDTVLGKIEFNVNGRSQVGAYVLHKWDGRRFVPAIGN